MLFRQPVLPSRTLAAARLKAEGIIRAHRQMGCTAAGIASLDLAGGLDLLLSKKGLPWISLNLVDDKGKHLFPARILTQAGDLRVSILGLTGPVRKTNVRQNGYRVLDWQATLPPALEEARQEADMIILLSSYPFRVNQEIARREKGITLILQAGILAGNMAPRVIDGTLICQTGSRGKYLGVLDLDRQDPSSCRNRFIALKTTLPLDRQVEAIVRQTMRQVNELHRRQLADQRRQRKEQQQARQRLKMLTGSAICSGCHQRQAAFWRRTRHATAWQTLAVRQRQLDRDCQSCHVTLPAGTLTRAEIRTLPLNFPLELRGVGCEACHGPGRKHAADPAGNHLRRPVASTCTRCHRDDHDTAFSFADKLPLVRCPP